MRPGELETFRAVGVVAFWLGAVGGVSLWRRSPRRSATSFVAVLPRSRARRWVGDAARAVAAHRPAVARVAPLVGTSSIAAGIANMDGGREVYEGFYLYAALSACYFLPTRQVRVVLVVVAAAAALPVLEDASADSIVRWAYVPGAAMLATVLQSARARVRAYADEARALALRDELTGVLNRHGLKARAGAEIARARRHGEKFALVYLDLDGFKQVNDNLSHATGDRVLQRAARRDGLRAPRRGRARARGRGRVRRASPAPRRTAPTRPAGWSPRSRPRSPASRRRARERHRGVVGVPCGRRQLDELMNAADAVLLSASAPARQFADSLDPVRHAGGRTRRRRARVEALVRLSRSAPKNASALTSRSGQVATPNRKRAVAVRRRARAHCGR